MKKILTTDELAKLCGEWQAKLGLLHWDIAVRICHKEDLPEKVQADNKMSLTTEKALISIIDSSEFPDSPFEQDMEVSLVHELLHIPLEYIANFEEGSLENILLEAFIERTARLLVELSRK